MITPTRSWPTPTPREGRAIPNPKGTPPQEGRANPEPEKGQPLPKRKKGQPQTRRRKGQPQLQTREGQPSPRERSPTPTQEKEGPIPFPRVGRTYLSIFLFNNYDHEPSHPPQEGRVNPNFKPPLLLGQAWPSPSGSGLAPPLPFLLAGPLAFPFSPFWLAFPLGAWPTPTRRANPHPKRKGQPSPEKEGRPLPREGRANPKLGRERRAKTTSPRKKNQKARKRLI